MSINKSKAQLDKACWQMIFANVVTFIWCVTLLIQLITWRVEDNYWTAALTGANFASMLTWYGLNIRMVYRPFLERTH